MLGITRDYKYTCSQRTLNNITVYTIPNAGEMTKCIATGQTVRGLNFYTSETEKIDHGFCTHSYKYFQNLYTALPHGRQRCLNVHL